MEPLNSFERIGISSAGKNNTIAPNLLLLDEPTNFLDVINIKWLVSYIKSQRKEFIIISL